MKVADILQPEPAFLLLGQLRGHQMKCAVLTILAGVITVIFTEPALCMSNDFPPLHSLWRSEAPEMCIEITGSSERLTGSNDNCVQISASGSKGPLLSGYACARGDRATINVFRDLGGDNSMGPDILIGTYDGNTDPATMVFQYCV